MTTPPVYDGEPTMKSRVLGFLQQHADTPCTKQQVASGIGLTADRISSTLYNLSYDKQIPVTKAGLTEEGISQYMYQSQPKPAAAAAGAEIVATPDGRMRLAVPGEEPEAENPESSPEGEREPMPIGDKLIIAGNPLPNGDIVATDDQGWVWRATRMV